MHNEIKDHSAIKNNKNSEKEESGAAIGLLMFIVLLLVLYVGVKYTASAQLLYC